MIGLSTIFHGLILFCAAKGGFYTPPPVSGNQFVSTVKIIKTGEIPQRNVSNKEQEEKITEKPIEPLPEPIPSEEVEDIENVAREDTESNEKTHENTEDSGAVTGGTLEEDNQNNVETQGGMNEAGDSGTVASNDDEELMAYIKEFINKNLIYPPMARRRNIQGIVGVSFEIDYNGGLSAARVDHSSGSAILDNAALSLIKKMPLPKNVMLNRTLVLNINIEYKLTE
jgi:protein TonB